ncbi:hypothetical protein B9Z55_002114 [Caenorhabditis nigoni]|uniref:Uncharacterized protein n=2 Tax=Caenorhabditis nigoni TaxID=1611254 RepID=A0A2G5VIV2_9PELO|nr:hypothetical protein B9Z55_002114 [Caenorhabditis nigoni]
MMNPADHWNPGWQQFMLNQQRAQAGGNRQAQPQAALNQFIPARQNNERNGQQQRRNNVPAQNRRIQNRNVVRREHRNPARELITRDDLERIEATTRKNFQTRTALEYDNRENQCWLSILNDIDEKSRQFSTTPKNLNSGDIQVQSEENICSNLRVENQNETILTTKELLPNFDATEQELSGALANLEIHLRTNALEYELIDNLYIDLIESAGKLTNEINELDDILRRVDRMRLQQ